MSEMSVVEDFRVSEASESMDFSPGKKLFSKRDSMKSQNQRYERSPSVKEYSLDNHIQGPKSDHSDVESLNSQQK